MHLRVLVSGDFSYNRRRHSLPEEACPASPWTPPSSSFLPQNTLPTSPRRFFFAPVEKPQPLSTAPDGRNGNASLREPYQSFQLFRGWTSSQARRFYILWRFKRVNVRFQFLSIIHINIKLPHRGWKLVSDGRFASIFFVQLISLPINAV